MKRERTLSEHNKIIRKIRISYIGWNTLYWILFTAIIAALIFVEYKLFIDSNVWTWIMSFIVDSGAILGYLFGLHNKMHKSISREKLIPRIVRNHHRKK